MYEQSSGRVRLEVLWEDLITNLPRLGRGEVRVLDAGGGAGELAIRLAQAGNEVVLSDPSRQMLARAETAIQEAGVAARVSFVPAPIQALKKTLEEQFDVIICHAVLNWVAEPEEVLGQLVRSLKPEGHLSLMFGNRNGWVLKRALSGDYGAALRADEAGSPRAPYEERLRFRQFRRLPSGWSHKGWGDKAVPLDETTVREWLTALGFVVQSKAGIRIFHDHLAPELITEDRIDELLALEKTLRNTEPFASLGRLTHFVCIAPAAPAAKFGDDY